MKWIFSWFMLFLTLGIQTAHANISVYPMTVVLNDKGSTLEVRSLSQEPSYVKITIKRLVYRMDSVEPLEQDINAYKDGIFAVPNRLVLPAGGKRTIRFFSSTPAQTTERAYRVYVETVPPVQDSRKLDEPTKLQTSVSVNLIWGALLLVPPVERAPALIYMPETSLLKNSGNTFIRVVQVSACQAPQACKELHESIPPLPPQGEFNIRKIVFSHSSAKEVRLLYEDRSSKMLHELKIAR